MRQLEIKVFLAARSPMPIPEEFLTATFSTTQFSTKVRNIAAFTAMLWFALLPSTVRLRMTEFEQDGELRRIGLVPMFGPALIIAPSRLSPTSTSRVEGLMVCPVLMIYVPSGK